MPCSTDSSRSPAMPRPTQLTSVFFFFHDPATTDIYTLSLHDALPIFRPTRSPSPTRPTTSPRSQRSAAPVRTRRSRWRRSEEHTSELQSQSNLVCRLLLEKKKQQCDDGASHHYIDS